MHPIHPDFPLDGPRPLATTDKLVAFGDIRVSCAFIHGEQPPGHVQWHAPFSKTTRTSTAADPGPEAGEAADRSGELFSLCLHSFFLRNLATGRLVINEGDCDTSRAPFAGELFFSPC